MDKRFPSTGTKDPFAYKPEYNKGVGPAAPIEAPAENNPFSFKPEYNQEVKKKVGGNELQAASPTSSGSPSTSQLPVETSKDFLLKDVDQSDFYGRLEADSQKYLNAVRGTQGAAPVMPISNIEKDELARKTKTEILSNPAALGSYTKKRIEQLNKDISNLTQKAEEEKSDYGISGGRFFSATDYDPQITKAIKEKRDYINQLKGNVADVVSDFVVADYTPANFNPAEVGRKILAVADPEMDAQFKLVEKNGLTLPGIRNEELKRLGLAASESYLLKQPDTPERESFLALVKDYQNKFDEENPQSTAQRVREKIAAQIYKTGESSWLGFGYSPEALKKAAEDPATGLTEGEKKVFYANVLPLESKIIGTDIPTSGFTRSFYNAFEKSAVGTGKSIGDITGLRTEGDQASDALNQEIETSRNRAPGQSPTAQAQLAYLNDKATKEKLTQPELDFKKRLENYVGVRNNWSKFKDGVGDLTGQVVQIALLTKGIGAAGGLLATSGAEGGLLGGLTRSALGAALSNETTGLIVSGYLNSYDNYKQQATQLMPGEDQAADRDAYAKIMASVEGASELIFRDTKILKAFTRNVAPAAREITQRLINGEITQQIAREEFQAGLQKYLKPFAKSFVKAEVSEGFEEGIVDVAQGIAESAFAGTNFEAAKVGKQAVNTFLTTMLYSPLVSGMAAHGAYRQNRSQNAFMKSAILSMAVNPAEYLKSVEDLQLDNSITQQEANDKIQLIKSANKYLTELPASRPVTTKVGELETTTQVPLDYPQVTSYLVHRMNEGIIEEKLQSTTDPIVQQQLNKDLKRSQEIRKGIFAGKIGVTPDIQDVTDNPEQATELGIADSNQMLPAELIGTPFTSTVEQAAVPVETSKIQELTESQIKDATDYANELKSEGIIPDTYHNMITEKDATPFWEMVAQQAQNMDANWQPLEGDENTSEQAAIDAFGETVVDYAKELYPIVQADIAKPKIEINEEQKQETIPASEEDSEESSGPETTTERVESQERQVLAERGVELAAVAPLTEEKTAKQSSKLLEVKSPEFIDFFEKIKSEVGSSTSSDFVHRIDLPGITNKERIGAIADIEKGKDSKRGKNLINVLEEIFGTGEVPFIRGRGNQVERSGVPISELFSNDVPELTDAEIEALNTEIGEEAFNAITDEIFENINNPIIYEEESTELSDEDESATKRTAEKGETTTSRNKQNESDSQAKTISERGKELANKIRSLKSRRDIAQANIFGIAVGIYDGAIETVATAIEAGAVLADAINQGIQYIRENGGDKVDAKGFREHLQDIEAGKRPKVKVQVGEEEQEEETEAEPQGGSIADYRMTTTDKVNKFLSGDTWEDVFGEAPEGDQSYLVQGLSDMLQDGKNMIAIAQKKWGGDVMMYGKNLFQLIQAMSNDAQLSNKKAVILATFLGELQEAKLRSPERFDAISQLEKAVFSYYQNYMNIRGKEVVAGRLLRFYRDKYIADVFADRILEKEQAKAKKAIQQKEQQKNIDNETASEEVKPITKEEKSKEDKAAKEKSKKAKETQAQKKKIKPNDAKAAAEQKLKDIEGRLGTDAQKGLIGRIKDAINKLNCK